MQHKHKYSRRRIIIGTAVVGIAIVIGALMTTNVPAPQQPVEKELDAKAFLEQKQ